MKIVSIIIPFYGQNESQLTVPLASINNQLAIDFDKLDVHLVNDGGKPVEISLLRQLCPNLNLHYHELKENGGHGAARQYGVKHSESEYLMFIDADDQLFQENSLFYFFDLLEKFGDHEIISSFYNREGLDEATGNITLSQGMTDISSVFARWFRREFLQARRLKFSPELRMFEDFYFMGLANMLVKDQMKLEMITYISHYRGNSLTHTQTFVANGDFVKHFRLQLIYLRNNGYKIELKKQLDSLLLTIFLYHASFRPNGKDEEDFQTELHLLVKKFPQVRKKYSAELQAYVDQRSRNKQDLAYGIKTDDLKKFLMI